MNKTSLLKDSARAAGIPLTRHIDLSGKVFFVVSGTHHQWNPLQNVSQAIELALKLGLCLDISETTLHVGYLDRQFANNRFRRKEIHKTIGNGNNLDLLLLAIVEAAASIANGDSDV